MKNKLTLLLILTLVLSLVFAFTSCGGNNDTDTNTETETISESDTSTGTDTEVESDSNTETESDTETETEVESDTNTETESDTETETEVESDTNTETESDTDTETEVESDTDTETETDTETDEPEHVHTEEIIPAVEPTCTETGLTEGKKCSDCGEILVEQTETPASHTEETIPAVAPTCTEAGLTEGKKCSKCGEVLVKQTVIETSGHKYENSYICSLCEYVSAMSSEGLKYQLSYDKTYYKVIGIGTCTDIEIVIPYTYNDLPVTSIGSKAFYSRNSLASITIPGSVTSIESNAFNGCHKLVEIYNLSSLNITVGSTNNGYIGYCASIVHTSLDDESIIKITEDGYLFAEVSDSKIYLVDYIGNETELTLPENYNGNNYEIYRYAFYERDDITKVTIPDSITSIGDYAFYNCTSLTSITIPDSVTSIGDYVFWSCKSLVYNEYENAYYLGNEENPYVVLIKPKDTSITSCNINKNTKFIYSDAFSNCSKLTSITIADSVTSIGKYAFCNCSSLTSVTIGNSVASIGYGAFSGCKSLTSITLPDRVTSIENYAFDGCNSLTSVTIGDCVTSIGFSAFSDCTALNEVNFNATAMNDLTGGYDVFSYAGQNGRGIKVTIGKNVTKIPAYLFYTDSSSSSSPKITSVVFEEGSVCESIGNYAFCNCSSLTSVTIGDSITSIGYVAFSSCTSLESVTIGNSITSIGASAFSDCDSLKSVNYLGTIEGWCNISFGGSLANPLNNGASLYLNGELVTNLIIPNTVKEIKADTFSGGNFTSVVIPEGVTSIGNSAFNNCTALTEINFNATAMNNLRNSPFDQVGQNGNGIKVIIGKNVTRIPDCLFYNSSKIVSVEFEAGSVCKGIGEEAFCGCTSLISITIPDSITYIEEMAFGRCPSLASVNYLGTLEQWCNIRFYSNSINDVNNDTNPLNNGANLFICGELITNLVIPNTVTEIKAGAFCGGNFESITIPNSVTSIGNWAFSDCKLLTSITFPDSITYIGEYAFDSCESLTSVIIPNKVTRICEATFDDCINLTSIVFEENSDCEIIEEIAFYGCTSLTNITIPNSITRIGEEAFYGCTSLISITIPDSVTSIGYSAFDYCDKLVEVYNLSSLNITAGLENNGYIGYYAKVVHTSLDEKSILETVDDYIFMTWEDKYYLMGYVGNDTELTLPESYNGNNYEIYQYAFYERDDITKVIIPDGVTHIGDRAFRYCRSLTSVTLGDDVISIGYAAFANCNLLTSIEIPDSVTSIGNYAFAGCSNLTNVTFEDANGWYVTKTSGATSGTNLTLTNASTNATYLTSTYDDYYWYKK